MWPKSVKDSALVACGRRCCICHRFCGLKMELHHIVYESRGGKSDLDNCIPLCFDCHAEVGYYNPGHPKGTKYSAKELRMHRDNWYQVMSKLAVEENNWHTKCKKVKEFYEGQQIELKGFVWRESFPGPPNYKSFITDSKETYWMLILPEPISLFSESFEDGSTFEIKNINKLQLVISGEFYKENRDIVLSDVIVRGKLFQGHTGHHHGQALFELSSIVNRCAQ